MSQPLVSLRGVADAFNAGKCQLQTNVELRVGDDVTRWVLVIHTEELAEDDHGQPLYQMLLYRADAFLGEPESRPDEFWAAGPRDVDGIAEVFGIDPDVRVWTKGSRYARE